MATWRLRPWVAGEGLEARTAWMDEREKALIKQYDTYGPNGLNSTKGGGTLIIRPRVTSAGGRSGSMPKTMLRPP